jgi:hypothetical protein
MDRVALVKFAAGAGLALAKIVASLAACLSGGGFRWAGIGV